MVFPWFSYGFQAPGADLAGQALAERFHEAVRDVDATYATRGRRRGVWYRLVMAVTFPKDPWCWNIYLHWDYFKLL